MVNPLIPGVIFIFAVGMTALMFTVGTPIIETMYDNIAGDIDVRGIPATNTMMLLWYGIPLVIDVLTGVWFIMVITRRQPVTRGIF